MLEMQPLKNAVNRLERALLEYEANPSEFTKDSCIKRFEFTYASSLDMIRDYVEELSTTSDHIDSSTFKLLFQEALEQGIVSDVNKWVQYREYRNKTSHTYDEKTAEDVFSAIPDFLEEVRFVVKRLSELSK